MRTPGLARSRRVFSGLVILRRCRALRPMRVCATCSNHGEIGGFVGRPGSGCEGYEVEPCPDPLCPVRR